MLKIPFHYLIFLIIIYSNGLIIYKFTAEKKNLNLNIFEVSILGLIFTGFLAVILNFFFPLTDFLLYINLILSLIILYYYRNEIKTSLSIKLNIFIFTFFILSILSIYGSGFSDDLNHYHGGSIINSDNSNYIIGSNFLHNHYGYSSIWLILHSYLNFNDTFLQDIHILNGIILFLCLSYFAYEIYDKKNNSKLIFIASFFIFFFLVKYTRLKEFGLDRPGVIIYCFLIYFFLKLNNLLIKKRKEKNIILMIIGFISLFLISIKITFISCALIPLFFLYNHKCYSFLISKYGFIFFFAIFCIIFKNFLISGCLIYPLDYTCISIVSWNSKDIASNILLGTELLSKSFNLYNGELTSTQYVKGYNWVKTWYSRNFEELNNFVLTSFFVFILLFASSRLKYIKEKFHLDNILIFLLLIINTIIFFKSPVIRFHHLLFILFFICLFLLIRKSFIKNSFYGAILVLLILFNFNKNIIRINDTNLINNPYKHIKSIGWYRAPTKQKIQNFEYYIGWIDAHPVGNMDLSTYKHKKLLWFDVIYK